LETITFYSYKGGSGRTLAVANAARYLARFGQKVVAVDFDVEAPGLHYKFSLDQEGASLDINNGVLDYIHTFATEGIIPDSLEDYVVQVPLSPDSTGTILVMPAGRVPFSEYWQKLAQINWHELLYAPGARGIEFFLEFKERIRATYNPDFLLIDSRTGITELGGVATAVLPEKMICFLSNSRENLEGARAILRSIRSVPRPPQMPPVDVLPVLSRVPEMTEEEETELIRFTLAFLNEEAPNLEDTLSLPDLFVLHSEPDLQVREQLRIGGDKSVEDSTLLVDYLCLFARVVPAEILSPIIESVVREKKLRAFENPVQAENELRLLAQRLQHPLTYQALLQLCCLRKAEPKIIFDIAQLFWRISRNAGDPALLQAVQQSLPGLEPSSVTLGDIRFVNEVWRGNGSDHVEIGMWLAEHYRALGELEDSGDALSLLLEAVSRMSREQIKVLAGASSPLDFFSLLDKAGKRELASEFLLVELGLALKEVPVPTQRIMELGIALKRLGSLPSSFEQQLTHIRDKIARNAILNQVRNST